jgi:hypothetical protein
MIKRTKRMLGVILVFCLIFAQLMPVSAKEGYTYTIRIFAGAQGTIKGQDMVTISGLHYGDRFSFNQSSVTLSDGSRYYIKGIRESGKDNNTITESPSFIVTEDMDYVIGYGLLGDAVAYTVNYVDNNGNTLAASETYYGNVGDRPVIAYLYIDGYVPQAYNLTGTLLENPADNQFTFIYTPLSELTQGYTYTSGNTIVRTNVIYEDEGVIVIGSDNSGVNGAGNGAGGGNAGADAAGGTQINDEQTPTTSVPAEIVDIRDEQIPLADGVSGDNNADMKIDGFLSGASVPLKVKIAAAVAIVLAVALVSWIVTRRKKDEDDESEQL